MPDQPDNLDDIKKIPKLCAALLEYMKRIHCEENFFFYFDKGDVESLYKKYIDPQAKLWVNLPANLAARAEAMVGDFKDRGWPKLIKECKAVVKGMVEPGTLMGFYDSKEYEKYARKEKMGDPRKAARLLGIKNVKLLEEAMLAVAMGEDREADKLLKQLAREEHIKEEVAAVRKGLADAGFM